MLVCIIPNKTAAEQHSCRVYLQIQVLLGNDLEHTIDVIYSYIIWTDNWSTLPEADTRRQEGKYPMIKVLHGCIPMLPLHSVNSVLILYRTGNMQSAILLSFVASSSLPPCSFNLLTRQCPVTSVHTKYITYMEHIEWGCENSDYGLLPIETMLPPALSQVLKLVSCGCKKICGPACGCKKAGLLYSSVCGTCQGTSCLNTRFESVTMSVMQMTPLLYTFSQQYLVQVSCNNKISYWFLKTI